MDKDLIQCIEDSIKENWELPVLYNYQYKQYISYGDLAQKIAKLHVLFEELGIKSGDHIALVGDNSSEWISTFLATITYGAVVVPILQNFNPKDICQIIEHSDSILLFVDEKYWEFIENTNLPQIRVSYSLLNFQPIYQKNGEKAHVLQKRIPELLRAKYPNGMSRDKVQYVRKNSDETIVISYTSGTTGFTKGVMLTGRNFLTVLSFTKNSGFGKKGEKVLSILPMAHMFGCVYDLFLPVLYGGYTVLLNSEPNAQVLMGAMQETKPEWIFTVPLFVESIYKKIVLPLLEKKYVNLLLNTPIISSIFCNKIKNKFLKAMGGNLQLLTIGGAALDKEVEAFYTKIKFPITVGYGMTECAPSICSDFINNKPFTVGRPITNVNVKIDSKDPNNVPGEILVKGPNVMKGYYKNETATKEAFTDDGWLKTGDLGTIDFDGYICVKGRIKNMLLTSSGQNIYPEEIEGKLNKLIGINESLVVLREGKLTALIVPDHSVLSNNVDLNSYFEKLRISVNKELATYEYIYGFEIQEEEFKKTPKNSIRRFLYE